MSDSRRTRGDSSKRKSRHDSEDLVPRKKHHRHADSNEDMQLESGSNETGNPKGKSAPRDKEFTSVNELKRRIRDVKRLLNKGTLPPDARIVQERALAGYEQDLADETARRDRSHLISKYHFVRFLGMQSPASLILDIRSLTVNSFIRSQNCKQESEQTPPSRKRSRTRLQTESPPSTKDPRGSGQPQLHNLLPPHREIHLALPQVARKVLKRSWCRVRVGCRHQGPKEPRQEG